MGVLGPPANAYGYILPNSDAYATLINATACPNCPDGRYELTEAHALLLFDAPCEIPVTVSIIPAIELSPSCLAPDWSAAPLCSLSVSIINDGGVLNQCVDYSFPFPPGCYVDGPAFLVFTFDQGSCANGRPAFCGPSNCTACTQYNFYPGGYNDPGDDLCAVLAPFDLKGNIMFAQAACQSLVRVGPAAGKDGLRLSVQPNPSPGVVGLSLDLPRAARLRLQVFDASGRRVRTIADGWHAAGTRQFRWDGRTSADAPAPAGIYMVRVDCEGRSLTRRIVRVP